MCELEAMLVGLAWTGWSVRLELAIVVALVAVQRLVGDVLGWVAAAALVGIVLAVPQSRRWSLAMLRAMRVRRAWAWAST